MLVCNLIYDKINITTTRSCIKLYLNVSFKAAHAIIENHPSIPPYIRISNNKNSSMQKRIDIGNEIIKFGGEDLLKYS